MNNEIALFSPIFNEQETLGEILARIPVKIDGVKTRLYIVDDGSEDRSAEIAREFTDNVIVLPHNMGVGAATKVGLQKIVQDGNASHVIKFDADGQHDIELIPRVYRLLSHHDVVTCSRFHPESDQSSTPLDRLILNITFSSVFKAITGVALSDVRTGFMGFRIEHVELVAPHLIVERYGIPIELLLRVWNGRADVSF